MMRRFFGIFLVCMMTLSGSQMTAESGQASDKDPKWRMVKISMQNSNLSSFIPHEMRSYNDSQIYSLIYNTLVSANYLGTLSPEIAENWKIEGNDYIFKIKENVFFHNGKRLKVDDIFFTFKQLILDTHQQNKEVYTIEGVQEFIKGEKAEISGLIKINDFNFIVRLIKPFNYFLYFLTSKLTSIIPLNYTEMGKNEFQKKPVGTGPFLFRRITEKIIKHRKFTEFEFTKNRKYFNKKGNVDIIKFYIPTEKEKLKTLTYFDIFLEDDSMSHEDINHNPLLKTINTAPEIIAFLALNPKENSFLKNSEFRKVINHLIEREKLIKDLSLINHIPAHSMIPASLFGYNPYYRMKYNKAEKIIPLFQGKNSEFTLVVYAPQVRMAQYLKKELKKAGITVNIKTLSDKKYFEIILKNVPHSLIVEGITDYPTSYNFLNQLYEKGGTLNYFQIQSPQIKYLIEILPEMTRKEEIRTIVQINRLMEEESIYIPLYNYSNNFIVKDKIKKIIFKYGGVIDFSTLEVKNE